MEVLANVSSKSNEEKNLIAFQNGINNMFAFFSLLQLKRQWTVKFLKKMKTENWRLNGRKTRPRLHEYPIHLTMPQWVHLLQRNDNVYLKVL